MVDDPLIKYACFIPLTTKFIGIGVVDLLFKNVYTLDGSTHHIIYENYPEFFNNLFLNTHIYKQEYKKWKGTYNEVHNLFPRLTNAEIKSK